MDPLVEFEFEYLKLSRLSIHTSVLSPSLNSEARESSGFSETTDEIGGGSIRKITKPGL